MKHVLVLSSLATSVTIARAAPAHSLRAPGSSIATQCINSQIRQNWLVSECLTGVDSTTRIESATYLGNKVENRDGDLAWSTGGQFDGGYFTSCDQCSVDSTQLKCRCKTQWASKKGVSYWNGAIDLDEHISVYNGHLLSNLLGPPSIPTTSSSYPIPSQFDVFWGGHVTCPTPSNPSEDFCKAQRGVNQCETADRMVTNTTAFQYTQPLTCFVPVIYFPDIHYQFESLKVAGEGAWEVLGYADEQCTGEPVATLGPDQAGVCEKVNGPRVKAVTVRPAFNGDPK